jgi:hypothetical protein
LAGYSGTPLVKKIGIKAGHRLALVDAPTGFKKELVDLPADIEFVSTDGKAGAASLDVILFFMKSRASLEKQLPKLKTRMAQAGMIWTAWPKKVSGIRNRPEREHHPRQWSGNGVGRY